MKNKIVSICSRVGLISTLDPHGIHARMVAKLIGAKRSCPDHEITLTSPHNLARSIQVLENNPLGLLCMNFGRSVNVQVVGPNADQVFDLIVGILYSTDFSENHNPFGNPEFRKWLSMD